MVTGDDWMCVEI